MGNHDLINIHLVITFKWKKLGFHILLVHYLWWNSLERTMIIHRRRNGWGGEGVAPPPIFFLQSYTNHKKNFLFFGPRISDKSTPPRSWPWHTILNFFYFFFMFLCFTRDSSFILFTYSCRSKVERFDLMKLILKCDSVLKIFQIFFFS